MKRLLEMTALVLWLLGPAAAHAESPDESVFRYPARALQDATPFAANEGAPGLIIMFQAECPWCQRQFSAARELQATHPKLQVVALGLQGKRSALTRELRRARSRFPAYQASPALLTRLGNPVGTPVVYAVDETGRVVDVARGYCTTDKLNELVAALDAASP